MACLSKGMVSREPGTAQEIDHLRAIIERENGILHARLPNQPLDEERVVLIIISHENGQKRIDRRG